MSDTPPQRDSHGRWVPGCDSPHREKKPKARKMFREAFQSEVTEQDVRDLVRVLLRLGKEGDVHAAREVLDRLMGKPKQALDVEIGDAPINLVWSDTTE